MSSSVAEPSRLDTMVIGVGLSVVAIVREGEKRFTGGDVPEASGERAKKRMNGQIEQQIGESCQIMMKACDML